MKKKAIVMAIIFLTILALASCGGNSNKPSSSPVSFLSPGGTPGAGDTAGSAATPGTSAAAGSSATPAPHEESQETVISQGIIGRWKAARCGHMGEHVDAGTVAYSEYPSEVELLVFSTWEFRSGGDFRLTFMPLHALGFSDSPDGGLEGSWSYSETQEGKSSIDIEMSTFGDEQLQATIIFEDISSGTVHIINGLEIVIEKELPVPQQQTIVGIWQFYSVEAEGEVITKDDKRFSDPDIAVPIVCETIFQFKPDGTYVPQLTAKGETLFIEQNWYAIQWMYDNEDQRRTEQHRFVTEVVPFFSYEMAGEWGQGTRDADGNLVFSAARNTDPRDVTLFTLTKDGELRFAPSGSFTVTFTRVW